MSQENVEVVHRVVDAWNRGDVDAFLSLYDPDCEVVFPPEVPEPGPFHGHAELKQWVEGFLAAWETHRAEVVEVMDAGDDVVAVLHMVGRGSGSGVDLDETDAHVFTIRENRIARWQNFNARVEALEAAGLSELAMSEENVELHYEAIDAFNRRDLDALLALADPDIEWFPRIAELEGGGPYRGHDGVRRWWEEWLAVAPDFGGEVEDVGVLGDVTVVRVRLRGHGVGSGASMEQTVWQFAEWRQRKCVRYRTFETEAEALEAAGLPE